MDLPTETTGIHKQLVGVLREEDTNRTAVFTMIAYRNEQELWRYVSIEEQYRNDGEWRSYQDEGMGCAPEQVPLLIELLQKALDGFAENDGRRTS